MEQRMSQAIRPGKDRNDIPDLQQAHFLRPYMAETKMVTEPAALEKPVVDMEARTGDDAERTGKTMLVDGRRAPRPHQQFQIETIADEKRDRKVGEPGPGLLGDLRFDEESAYRIELESRGIQIGESRL